MTSKKYEEVAQLDLFAGLPRNGGNDQKEGTRKRYTFDDETIKNIELLTAQHKKQFKKDGGKGNWIERDTIKKLVDDAILIKKRWG